MRGPGGAMGRRASAVAGAPPAPARRWTRRRVAISVAAVVAVVLAAGTLMVSAYVADTFVGAGRWTRSLATDPGRLGLPYRDVTFVTSDALTLRGWWIPATHPVGTVILLHGWAHNRTDILPQAPYLHTAGYDVLLFDFRSNGTSDGSVTTFGDQERRDLLAALSYAGAHGHGRIAAIGYSMGAVTAIGVASDEPLAPGDPQLAAVVADSPFASFDDLATRGFEQEAHLPLPAFPVAPIALQIARLASGASPVQPLDMVPRIAPRPILLISGLRDSLVPPDQAARIAAAAREPKETLQIAGAGHPSSPIGGPFTVAPTLYAARVLDFLRRALQSE